MMTTTFRNLFLLMCCLYSGVRGFAQIETVASYGNQPGIGLKATHTFGNRQWVLAAKAIYADPVWWETDLETGTTVQLDSVFRFETDYRPVFNSGGAFFMTYSYAQNGNDVIRYLNFLDTNGQRNIIGPFAGNTVQQSVRQLYIHNDKLIVCVRDASGDKVYESDGTVSGTHVLLQSPLPVLSIESIGNDLLIAVNDGQNMRLFKYPGTGIALLFKTLPDIPSVYSGFYRIGADDTASYFRVYRGAGHNQVWKSDLTDAGTQLFMDSTDAAGIRFDGGNFVLQVIEGGGTYYVKGAANDPMNHVRVPFASGLTTPEVRAEYTVGSYLRLLSHRHGIELGQFTENDTIRMLKDLNTGPGYGVPGRRSDYGYYNSPPAYAETADSTLYTIMTNGGDTQTYFYRVHDTLMTTVCPAEDPDNIIHIFLADHFLYWLRSTDTGLKLERWDLNATPVAQPAPSTLPDTSETWFRQLAYPDKYNFYGDPFHPDYSSDLKMTANGEVVIAFYVRYRYAKFFLSSEGAGDPLTGGVVFAKYDRYGQLLWTQSVGDLDMFLRAQPRMEIDNDGNIVLAGNFYKKGFFGTDSLQASSTGYYLAKLDGTSGELLWYKKIASTYYVDEVALDGMTIDNDNNIYLSVLYHNFGLSMDGLEVESDLSRMNAVARFSPDGSIDWLKNIPTPWTDKAGNTRFFAFDKERNRLVAAQSQGWYNWSSSCKYNDWGYFIQYLQPDGTLIDTFGFGGDDLGGLTTGFINADGQLTGFGYYRGELAIGDFDASSPAGNGCQVTEGFAFRYDPEIAAVTAAQKSATQPFFALDAQADGDAYYVYGTDKHNELVLIKFALDGTEIGYKRFGQQSDPFEFGSYEYFDVENGYIALLGTDFKRNDAYGIFPVIQNGPSKSILKIRDENWQSDTTWFGNLQLPAMQTTDEEIIVYPNPFTGDVTVVFGDAVFPYRAYSVFDMNGRKMYAGELNDLNFQQLSLGNLSAGAYFIRFTGGENTHTVRVVKVND